MKKTLLFIPAGVVLAFAIQSCNKPQMDEGRENHYMDSVVTTMTRATMDSINRDCTNRVMMAAHHYADSAMMAAVEHIKTPNAPHKTKETKATETPKDTSPNTGKKGNGQMENTGKKGADVNGGQPVNMGKKGTTPPPQNPK